MIILITGLTLLGMFLNAVYLMTNETDTILWGMVAFFELVVGILFTYAGMPHLIRLSGG